MQRRSQITILHIGSGQISSLFIYIYISDLLGIHYRYMLMVVKKNTNHTLVAKSVGFDSLFDYCVFWYVSVWRDQEKLVRVICSTEIMTLVFNLMELESMR